MLDIVSGTWYVECTDASLDAVGSTGASFFLHLISRGAQSCTKARPSDLPTTIGYTDAIGIGSFSATGFSRTRPIQRFFEFFLRVLLCMTFLLHPWGLEMFT